MGTKSYVKPICDPRVHSRLLAGLCVNINEIQSPRPKEDAKVGKLVAIRYHKDELDKIAKKLYNELSQKEIEWVEELLKGDNNFYDDHSLSQEDLEKIDELCNSCDDSHDDH